MTFKCLIVDDEPPAHKIVENYIGRLSSLSLAGNCYNAVEALNFLHKNQVDVLFLDINMPEMSGLDLLSTLQNPPIVILTTAYSEFALKSYEYEVLDYLLKPIPFNRFLKTINKLLAIRKVVSPSVPLEKETPSPQPTFFFVKADGVQHKIHFASINYLESKGNFVQVHQDKTRLLVSDTLSNMENKLSDHGFLRVHRSYIINIQKVKSVQGNLIQIGGATVPIGNSYRQIVLSRIGI